VNVLVSDSSSIYVALSEKNTFGFMSSLAIEKVQVSKEEVHVKCGETGWTVSVCKSTMQSGEEDERLCSELAALFLPEMVFTKSRLEFRHASGFSIQFNAIDALREWRAHPWPVLKVAASKYWQHRKKPTLNDTENDSGSGDSTEKTNAAAATDPSSPSSSSSSSDKSNSDDDDDDEFEWTFTTGYRGTLGDDGSSRSGDERIKVLDVAECRAGKDGVDFAMLQRPDPILFYDELVLFEDELADNGIAMLTCKVRVMPSCFFALLRFWMRVDDVAFRVNDTRLFHEFGSDRVVRDFQSHEDTIDEMRRTGRLPQDPTLLSDERCILQLLPRKMHFVDAIQLSK
jgi:type 2A phosphatase activator TIP41